MPKFKNAIERHTHIATEIMKEIDRDKAIALVQQEGLVSLKAFLIMIRYKIKMQRQPVNAIEILDILQEHELDIESKLHNNVKRLATWKGRKI